MSSSTPLPLGRPLPRRLHWALLRRLMAIGFEYRRGCVEMIAMHLGLVALTLSGLGLTGLGIDYIRSVIEPGSALPDWPLGLVPPAHWSPKQVVLAIRSRGAGGRARHRPAAVLRRNRSGQAHAAHPAAAAIDVYAKLQQLNFDFYDAGESSSIINRAAGDVNSVRSFVDGVFIKVLSVLLTLVVYLAYMLRVHVPLTVVCLCTTPRCCGGEPVGSRGRYSPPIARPVSWATRWSARWSRTCRGFTSSRGSPASRKRSLDSATLTTRSRTRRNRSSGS